MFGKTKINNEQYYGKKVAVGNGKFVGGNISLIPNQELIIDCHEKGIYIHQPFSIDGTFIPYEKY
ncbi:hypothetical protein [Caloramator sp. Dgby_cultured_2]|uniref:hypothetical protein n=1 Tax=Caloramator sp. Dgby_cultured_2 TaxID=3029174 RepID=UPI00237D5A4D|nr:hypothetical protein [Caloramator sp. Dgby_cultured_2]WDU82271.1 hypothetical protein PWK10_11230 [Caloramator sp. Dgby_cultured_2]